MGQGHGHCARGVLRCTADPPVRRQGPSSTPDSAPSPVGRLSFIKARERNLLPRTLRYPDGVTSWYSNIVNRIVMWYFGNFIILQ